MIAVVAGELYALANPYPVDGRVHWHAPWVRGYAPMNCYLLVEGDKALLLDTGLPVHQSAIVSQLHACLPRNCELEIMALRLGEFDSPFNLLPLVAEFDVGRVYGQYLDALSWADFRTDVRLSELRASGAIGDVATTELHSRSTVQLGSRTLDVFFPALRLLNDYWVYDHRTATLFTSDLFGYVVRDSVNGPWIITSDEDPTTPDEVRRQLLATRYWWIEGARTETIRRDLADVFDSYDIQRVAPGYGCILSGPEIVRRHFEMIDLALASAGRPPEAPEADPRTVLEPGAK